MTKTEPETSRSPADSDAGALPFEPPGWLRSGHAQTVLGRYLFQGSLRLDATSQEIGLADGDRLCVLESIPSDWTNGDPAAVLIHGLAGCARASYMVRFARRLVQRGIRVVRMNLRGAGAGFGLARGIYHAGRTQDVREVVGWLAQRAPGSPIALVGFSLGANLALKLAAEAADRPVHGLDCVLAANPPIDLAACARTMLRPENRFYDWNFLRWLRAEVTRLHHRFPDLGPPNLSRVRSVYDFNDRCTAPRNGFASADDYYARTSALPLISRIALPGLVIHAADDPFIPSEPFRHARFPATLQFELTRHGGHLGYVSRSRWPGDRRWLDARLTSWLDDRWGTSNRHLVNALSSRDRVGANLGACNRHA